MPSLLRASFLPRSVAIASVPFVATAVRVVEAQPSDASSPVPAAEPLAGHELDPTGAVSERVILLVRTPGDDGVMNLLRAELRESEWRILEIRPDERSEPTPLAERAVRERARAAMRVDARRGVIELWVLRPEGPIEETIDASGDPQSEQILALRGSEALRARGLILSRPTRAGDQQDQRPSTSVVRAMPPEPRESARARSDAANPVLFLLELGPGIVLSPGGLAPLPVVEIGMRLEFGPRWSLCLDALLPLLEQSVTAAEGQADVATWIFGGLLEFEWARFSFGGLRSGVGAAGTVTTMSGTAEPGFAGVDDTVATFAPLARTSFHAGLGRWMRLRTALMAGATIPPVRIEFGSQEVSSWGRPFVAASAVLETDLRILASGD